MSRLPSSPAPSSARPLHAQLALLLQGRIVAGVYAAGSQLDGEERLAQQFGVSRSTVRHALAELIDLGLVVSRKGSGNFVANPLPASRGFGPSAAPSFTGYLEDLYLEGAWTTDSTRKRTELKCPALIAKLLDCATGTRVVRYQRVRLLGGQPYGVANDYLPLEVDQALTGLNAESEPSIIHVLARAGLQPADSFQRLSPSRADRSIAKLLDLDEGEPVILVTGVTTDGGGRPLDAYQLVLHPAYEVQLRFTSAGAVGPLLSDTASLP